MNYSHLFCSSYSEHGFSHLPIAASLKVIAVMEVTGCDGAGPRDLRSFYQPGALFQAHEHFLALSGSLSLKYFVRDV